MIHQSKWTICEYDDDYVPIETGEADTELLWSEPLAVERSLCGLELTPAGEEQLVWSVTAATGPFEPAPDSNFLMEIVKDIFSYGGTSVDQVIADYFTNVHEWMPIVDKPMVVSALQSIRSTGRTGTKDDAMALLLLCMDMMNHHCHHSEHGANSMLYRATRRLFSLVETLGRSGLLAKLHAGLLLTAYECGHGMAAEACLTLATCVGLVRQLDMSASRNPSTGVVSFDARRNMCWAAIVYLDRLVPLPPLHHVHSLLLDHLSSALLIRW